MKPNKLIGILLFLIMMVSASAIKVTSHWIHPITITFNEQIKKYCDLDGNMPKREQMFCNYQQILTKWEN